MSPILRTAVAPLLRRTSIVGLSLLLLPLLAAGETPQATPHPSGEVDRFAIVMPYIDPQVPAIVRADLSRVDTAALQAWIHDEIAKTALPPNEAKRMLQDLGGSVAGMKQWIDAMTKAGGREVFVLLDPIELVNNPPAVIVPLGETADAAAIVRLLDPMHAGERPAPPADGSGLHAYGVPDFRAQRIGDIVAAGPEAALQRIIDAKAAAAANALHGKGERANVGAEWSAALSAGADAPVQLIIAPSPDTRRVIDELLPRLPPALGAGSGATLTRGLRWASIALELPPKPAVHLWIQSSDPPAAGAMLEVIHNGMQLAAQELTAAELHERQQLGERAGPGAARIATLIHLLGQLEPKAAGDHLVLDLEGDDFNRLVVGLFDGPLQKQRIAAARARSQNNMRQLLLACITSANDHKGEWPATLEDALKRADVNAPALLQNPMRPGTGYTYVKPTRPTGPSETIVLYEAEPAPMGDHTGRDVGFADGHVQLMLEETFQKAMTK